MLSSNQSPVRPGTPIDTPEIVRACLDAAGARMMAIRVGRIGPAGYRSCMPTPLRDLDDYFAAPALSAEAAAAERRRIQPPSAAEVAHMDEVYLQWLVLLGGATVQDQRRRRLVGLRALCWPDSDREDPHVWSWRRLGREFGVHNETVKGWHDRGIDVLVRRLLASRPIPCPATQRLIGEIERRRGELERLLR